MIKANELRIGNLILWSGGVHEIELIGKGNEQLDNDNGFVYFRKKNLQRVSENVDSIEPIPLTEEWLLKFGFELDEEDDGFFKRKIKTSVNEKSECLVFIYESYYQVEVAEINHVHQLQNLYFALTGEELTLKDEVL